MLRNVAQNNSGLWIWKGSTELDIRFVKWGICLYTIIRSWWIYSHALIYCFYLCVHVFFAKLSEYEKNLKAVLYHILAVVHHSIKLWLWVYLQSECINSTKFIEIVTDIVYTMVKKFLYSHLPFTFPHTCICLYMIIILVKWFWIFNFLLIKTICPLKFIIRVHFYHFLTELSFLFCSFSFASLGRALFMFASIPAISRANCWLILCTPAWVCSLDFWAYVPILQGTRHFTHPSPAAEREARVNYFPPLSDEHLIIALWLPLFAACVQHWHFAPQLRWRTVTDSFLPSIFLLSSWERHWGPAIITFPWTLWGGCSVHRE